MAPNDPYLIGWNYGKHGVDLPDHVFSLFSWAGWLAGINDYAESRAKVGQSSDSSLSTAEA
ncbi:hypothetical protein [Leptolyngbya sp. FACHB-261]|uniref:hypothetical protein n=1 Tax=Leptolyngbya sp. FACHB-261 TaxID=2692806 RepID=UPI0016825029|nr:hypothetical protein [Leptolyngbya sp. FACHB-261]MBD2101524.1 hypothetical protein [Leptolyngbya sp. FACHB-261]